MSNHDLRLYASKLAREILHLEIRSAKLQGQANQKKKELSIIEKRIEEGVKN